MSGLKQHVTIDAMREADIPRVREIERKCFRELWPEDAFDRELVLNKVALYLAARLGDRVIGYVGTWFILDESHITTFAVDPDITVKKVGQRLIWHLMDEVVRKGARWSTLEVNEDNLAAIHIYEKFGYKKIGTRKEYYENDKNAHVMWVGNLQSSQYREKLDQLKKEIFETDGVTL
jgi:[ribosomal protein S18]-alanine N-acetyltransferase